MAALAQSEVSLSNYRAFISYSHSDKAIASWLHKTLEQYRMPKKLIGCQTPLGLVPARLSPIFRDQDELPASGNLGAELQSALTRSLFLVVICSPASARSRWVNEEIRQFKLMHGANRVLALIVEGVPNAKADSIGQECFAPALKYVVSGDGEITDIPSEPIAADLRKNADGKRLAKLKLVSGLTGLQLDDLVQREAARRVNTLLQISAASILAAIFSVGLAVYANERRLEANAQRVEANVQRAIAEEESATARAVADFLVQSFSSANSAEANPNSVTARSILDRGAERIAADLQGQPIIQSRLSAIIAMGFNNLGLFNQAIALVDNTVVISGIENPAAFLIKAEALRRKGDIEGSMEVAQHAQVLAQHMKDKAYTLNLAEVRADIARVLALNYYQLGQHEAGLEQFAIALTNLENMPKPSSLELAKILQNRALLLSDIGDMAWAAKDLQRARELLVESVPNTHILVGQVALAQAQVNFLSGNLSAASEEIETALSILQVILENDNPTLADAFSMQGQILHGLGMLDEATGALSQAVEIYTKAYSGRHYLSGIARVYLGLIAGDKHDFTAAVAHFDEAKLDYDESYGGIHANHGDLLVNRATVLALAGDFKRANQYCTEGMRILIDKLGADAAFTQQLQGVCDDINNH